MPTPVILQEFGEGHPFTVDEINRTLRTLAGAINGLAGQQLIDFNPVGGNLDTDFVPLDGGDMTGPLTAPAILVGPADDRQIVLTEASEATLTVKGPVLKAAAVAPLALTISNPPTQSEVQQVHDKLNGLVNALKDSGAVA